MYSVKNFPFIGDVNLSSVSHLYTGDLGLAIDRLNDRYSFVMVSGRHRVFDHKEHVFCDVDSVKIYQSEPIEHNGKTVNPAQLWVNNRHLRRNFDKVYFHPHNHIVDNDNMRFNTWYGWNQPYLHELTVEQHERYIMPWLYHIEHVFCSGQREQFYYFMGWLSHIVQYPHVKPGVAIVIQSGQGFGKGIFMTLMSNLIGNNYVARISDAHQVAGGFSGVMRDKILINFDEATWGGDKKANGRLKALITESELLIEEKHRNPETIQHYARFLITSNNDYPIPIEHDDRRFFVPDVISEQPQQSYFNVLGDLLSNEDAMACWFTYLMNADISNFNVKKFPTSKARQKIKAESIVHNDVYRAFIIAAYNEEFDACELFNKNISSPHLYEAFNVWRSRTLFKNTTISSTAFGRAMTEVGLTKHKKNGTYVYNATRELIEKYLQKIGLFD